MQFLGRLLVGLPSEKKGSKFFNISVGRLKSLQEGPKRIDSRMQPIFSLVSHRLFSFPQTDNLSATLFDVLLGGASPKQVLMQFSAAKLLLLRYISCVSIQISGHMLQGDFLSQYLSNFFSQVLQKHNQLDQHRSSRSNSQFFLPQMLVLIFRYLSGCEDATARIKIISSLLDLLDSNASNIEALMVLT